MSGDPEAVGPGEKKIAKGRTFDQCQSFLDSPIAK
jgi:hypothetical protein